MHVPVENEKHLVRDTTSNAILNTDKTALRLHRSRRRVIKEKDLKIEDLADRLRQLEELVYSKFKE